MRDVSIKNLLAKYNSGSISLPEMALLETWYLQWKPEGREISHKELSVIKDEVWQSVIPVQKYSYQKGVWLRVTIAASLLLFTCVAAYYFLEKTMETVKGREAVIQVRKPDFKPGGNRATLTLADGTQMLLNEAPAGRLVEQGKVVVSKERGGRIVYGQLVRADKNAASSTVINTMTTPRGGQYQLTLSDGTKAWLNAASSITFPVNFSKTERRVVVKGEVYFEVTHNTNKPFIVSTGNQEIIVLGTNFNVKAYDDEAEVSTTLLAGSVRIKSLASGKTGLLSPGQQAKIYRNSNKIYVKMVNTSDVISWKNGYFLFDNQDIKSIMKIMSRWYDVDVVYQNISNHERFGGTFSRSSNMSEILNNLEGIGNLHFKMEGNRVVVLK